MFDKDLVEKMRRDLANTGSVDVADLRRFEGPSASGANLADPAASFDAAVERLRRDASRDK